MKSSLEDANRLIGFSTVSRRHESLYAFIARLVRSNLLSDRETRDLLPASWILRAFAPDDSEVPSPASDFLAALPLPVQVDVESKVSIDPWILFPTIAKASKRRLRGCPACFELGHHSYAFQDELLSRCPVHDLPLSDRCPHCAAPLWWRHRTIRESVFKCPRGCDLMSGLHAGLDDDVFEHLARHLDKHLAILKQLRSEAAFVSGPTHISYPPRLASTSYEDIYRPSPGLTGALLGAIRPYISGLSVLEQHYAQSDSAWAVKAQPLGPLPKFDQVEQQTKRMMVEFRRGTFRTELPLSTSISQALIDKLGMHAMLEETHNAPRISLASYMITTSEFNALQRILSTGQDAAHTHYDMALHEILHTAVNRYVEQEDASRPRKAIRIAETVSGLIQTPEQILWIRGRALTQATEAEAAWKSFSDSTDALDDN